MHFLTRLFQRPDRPAVADTIRADSAQNQRNREFVFNIVIVGSILFMAALLALLLYGWLGLHYHEDLSRSLVAAGGLLLLVGIRAVARRGHYTVAARSLFAFYMLLAGGSVWAWGIGTPFGVMMLALIMVLAGTILGSRWVWPTAVMASVIVVATQLAHQANWTSPYPGATPTTLGDALGHVVVFSILATISWLFGRQTERSLMSAARAERALEREKANLEVRVEKRTAELRASQIEEMRQSYQFAEVGQLSTSLLHDLANDLTVLTLELDNVKDRSRRNEALGRSQAIVQQLDTMIDQVRDRLSGSQARRTFALKQVIDEAVDFLGYRAGVAQVRIEVEETGSTPAYCYGDPLKCSQIFAILIKNAIDAYRSLAIPTPADTAGPAGPMVVRVRIKPGAARLVVTVADWGKGIRPADRDKIFKASYTTKRRGMGVGLYLAQQMVVTEFNGTLRLGPAKEHTEFIVTLPAADGQGNEG